MHAHLGLDLEMDVTNKARVLRHLEINETDFTLVSILPNHIAIESIPLITNRLFQSVGHSIRTMGMS